MNRLIIDDMEYELKEDGVGAADNTPSVLFKGRHYVGVEIVRQTNIITMNNALFTTDDAVDIYEGDKYWYVNYLSDIHEFTATADVLMNRKPLMPNERRFSDEKLAKEWYVINKPCLSVNDIVSISTNHYLEDVMQLTKEILIETAKVKINAAT